MSIRKDIKNFKTNELNKELDKLQKLKSIFDIALNVIPKFNIPATTLDYYAYLINYYGGWRLKQINKDYAQIYLLCYSFIRYQTLNDNLVEAFKKRVRDYETAAKQYVREQAIAYQDNMLNIKKRVSALLVAINNLANKQDNIPTAEIFKYISQAELLPMAKRLADENFDKKEFYWEYLEKEIGSIKLNLRPLFLAINFEFTNNKRLEKVVAETKTMIDGHSFNAKTLLPLYIKEWIPNRHKDYIVKDDIVNISRFEILLYRHLSYRIAANDVSLKYSFENKQLDDDLIPKTQWQKNKRKMLKDLKHDKLLAPIKKILATDKKELTQLYRIVNQRIAADENPSVKVTRTKDNEKKWKLRPLTADDKKPDESLFADFQQLSIVDVVNFVEEKTKFSRAFEAIQPRAVKSKRNISVIMAVVLANAIRIGARKMAEISDLNLSELLTAEGTFIRVESLRAVTDLINNAAAKLPIFKKWNINNVLHGSMDGTKIETKLENIKVRYSSKYFGDGMGVSAFNFVTNSFPLGTILIGANEYEGNFAFELFEHYNTSEIKPHRQSGDGHSLNQLNFALFDMIGKQFMPRIPNVHKETLWGFGKPDDYKDYMIKPTKFIDEKLLIEEWENITHIYHGIIFGTAKSNIIVKKLSSHANKSRTKKAFWQYNNILKSSYILMSINDVRIRHGVEKALNRGEAYHKLYNAIGLNNGGNLKGYSELDLEIWNECTRLIVSIICYYNTRILSTLFAKANKLEQELLIKYSPIAWSHINLLGFYQFCKENSLDLDKLIRKWDWKKELNSVEN